MPDGKILSTFKCNSCGGNIEIQNPRTKFVTCPYCGSTTDISGVLKDIKKGNPEANRPITFLKLGMIGYFENIAYKIIGRIRWINNYREYDPSENRYKTEKWTFDEWTLLSQEGRYKTLIEDSEGFYESETIIPLYPNFDTNNQIADFFSKTPRRVQEFGNSTISYFEGESSYLIRIGDSSEFVLYSYQNKNYSVEWRLKNNEIFEIEFFEEKSINPKKLAKKFKSDPQILNFQKKHLRSKRQKLGLRLFFILLGLTDIFAAIFYMGNFWAPTTYEYTEIAFSKLKFSSTDSTTYTADYTVPKKIYINHLISTLKLGAQNYYWLEKAEITIYWYVFNSQNDTLAIFRSDFYKKNIYKNKKKIKYAQKFYFNKDFSVNEIDDSLHLKLKFITKAPSLPNIKKTRIKYFIGTKATTYQNSYAMMIIGFIIMIFGFKIKPQ